MDRITSAPSPVARKADVVARALLTRIVGGELAVGSLLPKEAELAEEHGVNRSVVREAIKLLEVHRLVQPRRRRGTEVLDPLASLSPEVLGAMLTPRPGMVDLEVFADLLEIRASIDVQMTELAAARRTDADLAEMERCLVRLDAAMGDARSYSHEMGRLAQALARATQNRIYLMLVLWHEQVHADLGDIMLTVRQPGRPHSQGLRHLVDLIAKRDVSGVSMMVAAFHQWATPRLLAVAALRSGLPLSEAFGDTR